jgi:hypothetical protein
MCVYIHTEREREIVCVCVKLFQVFLAATLGLVEKLLQAIKLYIIFLFIYSQRHTSYSSPISSFTEIGERARPRLLQNNDHFWCPDF